MIIEQQTPQPATTSSPDRRRIAVVVAVVILAVAIGAVLGSVLMARGAASLGRSADYVPADSVMYFEARLDLPGAQRDNLRSILERFPSADADAFLTDALAATLDDALAQGNAPFDYSSDIAPWFDGSVAMAFLDYPMNVDPTQMEFPSLLAFFGTRDAAAATAFADEVRGSMEDSGATFTSTDHGGITIWVLDVDPAMMGMSMSNAGFAYAVTDDQLILGSGGDQVTRALDTEAGGDKLANRDDVAQLTRDLPEERFGTMVVDSDAIMAEMRAALESTQPGMADALAPYLEANAGLAVAALEFAPDALLFDAVSSRGDGATAAANGSRTLAEMVPADAILYVDTTNLGTSLEAGVAGMKAAVATMPDGDAMLQQLTQVESALGADLEELVSWIGDGAFTMGWDGEQIYAGLVLDAVDPAAAERRLSQLRSFAELAATDASSGISVATETVAGVDVTTIRFASGDMSTFGTPFAPALQYAIDGERVLIGLGDQFVPDALARDVANSLAQSSRYQEAVNRFGGQQNAATMFLDLGGLRAAIETVAGTEPGYQEIRPDLLPFDYMVEVTRVSGDSVIGRAGIVLR